MRRISGLALIFALIAMLGSNAALAQTPVSATPNIAELEGIESAVSRAWGVDFAAIATATPGADPAEIEQGLTALNVLVMKFDSDEHAESAYGAFQSSLGTQLGAMAQGGTPTVTEEDLPDLGDQAATATLHTESGDQETWYRVVLVRDGAYLSLTSALAGTSEDAAAADPLAGYVVNDGEEQGDEAIFVGEGKSSGGLWGFMPPAGHEVLAGLVVIGDQTLYPLP